ncbi:MAG TPA: serine--tRNA ligase [Candidatus Absconditabacterales bacterium]|nr:serine--tRNA ligase [Candidatus Absconditabacterales bacterium]
MIDLNKVRENLEEYKRVCKLKGKNIDVDYILELDTSRKAMQAEIDNLKFQQKELASKQDYEGAKALKSQIQEKEENYKSNLEKLDSFLFNMPQFIRDDVVEGKDESENPVLEKYGEIPNFSFEPKDHIELMEKYDMIDFARGAKVSGARSYYLKNDGLLLERALFQFAMDKMVQKYGFTPMGVPHIVDVRSFVGAGFFPGGEEDAYHLEKDDKWLIATAENSLISYHTDEILDFSELPKKYTALSPAYRREAGSYGKDTKGCYRVHQFNKIEQIIICKADIDESNSWHQKILNISLEILSDLGLPHQVVGICTGDLGSGKYVQHDVECRMPSRNAYGETHSVSSLLDFQSRRLGIRYRDEDGTIKYVYTLNNTVLASPRILIPIIENYQTEDGKIKIPEVLKKYMGEREHIQ